jgi:hypothetical protein
MLRSSVPDHVPAAAVGGITGLPSIVIMTSGLFTAETLAAAPTIGIAGIIIVAAAIASASHVRGGGGGDCINGIAAGSCCVPVAAAAPERTFRVSYDNMQLLRACAASRR